VGFQTLILPQLNKMEMVASAGKDCIQCDLTGYTVVAVPGKVLAIRLRTKNHVGLDLPNLPD
jgi:hypothetical protein